LTSSQGVIGLEWCRDVLEGEGGKDERIKARVFKCLEKMGGVIRDIGERERGGGEEVWRR